MTTKRKITELERDLAEAAETLMATLRKHGIGYAQLSAFQDSATVTLHDDDAETFAETTGREWHVRYRGSGFEHVGTTIGSVAVYGQRKVTR